MRWLGALAVVVLCGCAEEERPPFFDATKYRYQPTREAIKRGVTSKDFVRCDIRHDDCQERLFEAAKELYEGRGAQPPTRIVSPDEFDEYASSQVTDQQVEESRRYSEELFHALWTLGLMSPTLGPDDVTVEAVGRLLAAYFFIPDEVLVIDWHMDMDDPLSVLTLAHEYTHALQDAKHDLQKLHKPVNTVNERHGLLGLVEGEAEVFATLVSRGYLTEESAEWRDDRRDLIEDALGSPAPYFVANLMFPYTVGNEFATFAWLDGGNEAIDGLYENTPTSSRQILAGAGAKMPAGGWVETIDDTALGTVPKGFEVALRESFGAWIFHIFLETLAQEAAGSKWKLRLPGESVAMDLRGDEVVSFSRAAERVVVWRMRFEPDVEVDDVINEIERGAPATMHVRAERGDVLVFAGDSPDTVEEFASTFALIPNSMGGTQTGMPEP